MGTRRAYGTQRAAERTMEVPGYFIHRNRHNGTFHQVVEALTGFEEDIRDKVQQQ